jgi:hypothetical protein
LENTPIVPFIVSNDIGDQTDHAKTGWRLPPIPQSWTRTTLRFRVPLTDFASSFHLRFVSNDTDRNNDTRIAVDDFVVRYALEPEFGVMAGDVEERR